MPTPESIDLTLAGKSEEYIILMHAVLVLYGLAACLNGFRVFKITIAFFGAMLGVYLGYMAFSLFPDADPKWFLAAAGAGAILGFSVAFSVVMAGLFVYGSFLGTLIATPLASAFGGPEWMWTSGSALACGVLLVIFKRFLIVIATAFNGAFCVILGIALFMEKIPLTELEADPTLLYTITLGDTIYLSVTIALGIAGVFVQYGYYKKTDSGPPKRKERSDDDPDSS